VIDVATLSERARAIVTPPATSASSTSHTAVRLEGEVTTLPSADLIGEVVKRTSAWTRQVAERLKPYVEDKVTGFGENEETDRKRPPRKRSRRPASDPRKRPSTAK
jgi:hypothetical protein